MQESTQQAIERYLRSGDHDAHFRPWPGDNYVAQAQYGSVALRHALISAVRHRTVHAELPAAPPEQESVLDVLGRSVVVLTPATIDAVLERTPWLSTAWNLANLYLAGVGAELLADDAPKLLGLSEGTTCYLSAEYFSAPGRFDDFLVHEAAHIFHNCKRRTIGLRETRRREWLLEIEFAKRETFAYLPLNEYPNVQNVFRAFCRKTGSAFPLPDSHTWAPSRFRYGWRLRS